MTYNYKIYGLSSSEFPELILYIGYTRTSLQERGYSHNNPCKKYKGNPKKQEWIKDLKNRGFKLVYILLEENILTLEEAYEKEIHYIKMFKSFGAKLFNIHPGGRNSAYDHYRRVEAAKYKKIKVDQYDLFDNYITTYESMTEACKALKIKGGGCSHIKESCKGNRLVRKKFKFTFHGCPPIPTINYKTKSKKVLPLDILDMETGIFFFFNNGTEAAKYFNTCNSNIWHHVRYNSLLQYRYKINIYK